LSNVEELHDAISEAVKAYVKAMLSEEAEASITFPILYSPEEDGWGGPPVDDPLAIYLVLLADHLDLDFKVRLKTSIRDQLEITLDMVAEDGSHREGLTKFAKALRELADEIDEAIAQFTEGEKDVAP